ncbi:MAG: three-Cys-motif partner protein TcmP, partial [Opitutaceae bacterium]
PTLDFVERERDAFACLEHTLRGSEFAAQLANNIHLIHGDLNDHADAIVHAIQQRHPRGGGRTIFFLDQCGYVQVPPSLITRIHRQLSQKSEFIVNFAIDWLSDFLSDSDGYRHILDHLGLAPHIQLDELLQLKQSLADWRYMVEARIGQGLQAATGLPFFSPFYIEPEDNHRGYWLLHLAPHARARSAMTSIHWKVSNRSRHYGSLGLEILAYKPDSDPSLYLHGMSFNDDTRTECKRLLVDDLGRLVRDHYAEGISTRALEDYCCNRTIADTDMLHEALWTLADADILEIKSPTGKGKRARSLERDDLILPNRQIMLPSIRNN